MDHSHYCEDCADWWQHEDEDCQYGRRTVCPIHAWGDHSDYVEDSDANRPGR